MTNQPKLKPTESPLCANVKKLSPKTKAVDYPKISTIKMWPNHEKGGHQTGRLDLWLVNYTWPRTSCSLKISFWEISFPNPRDIQFWLWSIAKSKKVKNCMLPGTHSYRNIDYETSSYKSCLSKLSRHDSFIY